MLYHSTRNADLTAPSTHAVLEGIAPDGGLYICDPAQLHFDWQGALKLDTMDMAAKILSALLPDFSDMDDIVRRSYAGKFPTMDLTPLVPVGGSYVLELYHGHQRRQVIAGEFSGIAGPHQSAHILKVRQQYTQNVRRHGHGILLQGPLPVKIQLPRIADIQSSVRCDAL